jgi:sugar transferase (PEP-CTERM/EpsH1 system associated)
MSKDLENWLVNIIKVPPNKISQLYNGVNLNRFKLNTQKPMDLLPAHFRDPKLVIFGTVGRLDTVKDQITLVQAFIHLLQSHPEISHKVRLVVVGAGILLPQLQALSKVAGTDELIWFAGERPDVAELMQTLGVFVLPSINEGISNTILEAMATALPVIATEVGGNPELVLHQETGLLVPRQDPVAMAAAFKHYLDQPTLQAVHGKAGRARCESLFSLDRMVSDYVLVYDGLLQNNLLKNNFLKNN